jgi:hypothetical protein
MIPMLGEKGHFLNSLQTDSYLNRRWDDIEENKRQKCGYCADAST